MKKFIYLILFAGAIWYLNYKPPARWKGMPARHQPVQTGTALPRPFSHGGYMITPLARYSVTAIVLSRDRYRFDDAAELAPVDLALGWGPMCVADVINDLKISQSGRWYEYSWRNEAPLSADEMAKNSANTHCLPADKTVKRDLLAIKRHDLVTLEGYLIEVNGPNGYEWRSSLTRDDTGGHACEVMWITKVTRKKL